MNPPLPSNARTARPIGPATARVSAMIAQAGAVLSRFARSVSSGHSADGPPPSTTTAPRDAATAGGDPPDKPEFLGRALQNAGIAVFVCWSAPVDVRVDDQGDDQVDDRAGQHASRHDGWQWSGARFGIEGIAGPDGRRCLLDAVSEPDRPSLTSVLGLTSPGSSHSSHFRVFREAGQVIDLFCSAYSEPAAAGRPARVFGTIQDVSNQRRFESELAETVQHNHLLLATIDACPISITLADATQPDMPLIYANRMFEQVTGYAADEAVGRNCRFLQGPETETRVLANIRQAIAAGRPIETQLVNYRKDGSQFLNRFMLAPFHGQTGQLVAFIGLQTDITLEMKQKNADDQRQKMEALGRMMGGVAHELNNMLQPVTLLGQHIHAKELIAPEGKQHLEIILECNTKARDIVGDLLNFSRPTPRVAAICSPVELLDESLGLVRQALPRSIAVSVQVDGRPPPILMDRTMFSQILLNLANNASAAMGGKGELTILLDQPASDPAEDAAQPATAFARLRVIDTGCGMDRTTLDRAFEPFFTTKPIGQGTGLGLSVIYRFIQEMGGTIALESEPAKGTTVTILMPGKHREINDGIDSGC